MLLAPFIGRMHRRVWMWLLAITGAVLGSLPDLLGLIGFFILRDNGRLYNIAHSGAIKEIIQYIPMCWLHLWLDSFMHDPERTWEGFYLRASLSVLMWVANAVMIWWYVRIWQRNRRKYARRLHAMKEANETIRNHRFSMRNERFHSVKNGGQ